MCRDNGDKKSEIFQVGMGFGGKLLGTDNIGKSYIFMPICCSFDYLILNLHHLS